MLAMSQQNPHPLTPSDADTRTDPHLSLNEERRLSQLYEAKLWGLHQKVADLTQLYKESERDAENKLQFWQSKFLSTLQALQGSHTRVEGAGVEEARSERAQLESNMQSVQNENYELTQGMLSERRDRDEMRRERDLARRELCELRSRLVGREGELEDRERDNRTLVQRLEGVTQEIELLRRAVAARGRTCHKTNAPREAVDSQSGELTDVRQEMDGLLDELTVSREKIQSYEEMLARAREERSSQARLESDQVVDLQQRLRAAEVEKEECEARSDGAMRRKKKEFEKSQQEALESNQQLTELLEKCSQLQQALREKSVACDRLERRVADLNKALLTSLETQEQLAHSKQQDIDKLTGQANNLQRQLSKTNNKHILTKTQLEALNQQLQLETDRVHNYQEKLREATLDKEKLQREITLTQESRALTSPEEAPEGRHSCHFLSEEPLLTAELRTVGVMVNSLPAPNDKKNSPNFSQNYRLALQRGLSQVELGESTSRLKGGTDISPDSKLYWVRRVSEMSLQMKESSEYWSAQVKELTIQLEQLKHCQTET